MYFPRWIMVSAATYKPAPGHNALYYSAHLVGNNLNLGSVEDDAVDSLQLRRHNELPTHKPRLIEEARPIASLSAALLPGGFFIGLLHLDRITRGRGKRFHGPLYRRRTLTDPSPLLPHASPPAQPDY
jgi:hypothetical protein